MNGKEWRGFFSHKPLPFNANQEAGVLLAHLKNKQDLSVQFSPGQSFNKPLTLHVALLGMNISSNIAAGENHGRQLIHDFVVLNYYQLKSAIDDKQYHWQLSLSLAPIQGLNINAIAFWVSEQDKLPPLQACGGWLDNTI